MVYSANPLQHYWIDSIGMIGAVRWEQKVFVDELNRDLLERATSLSCCDSMVSPPSIQWWLSFFKHLSAVSGTIRACRCSPRSLSLDDAQRK